VWLGTVRRGGGGDVRGSVDRVVHPV